MASYQYHASKILQTQGLVQVCFKQMLGDFENKYKTNIKTKIFIELGNPPCDCHWCEWEEKQTGFSKVDSNY